MDQRAEEPTARLSRSLSQAVTTEMDPRVSRFLQSEGMTSLMNATKWRELACRLEQIEQGCLCVRVKYLLDDESAFGFSPIDWEWFKDGETSLVEWLDIETHHRIHQGRLVPEKIRDLGSAVEPALRDIGVPFSAEGSVLRVWGHVRPGAQPVLA